VAADLSFKISADLADVKAALADLKAQIGSVGSGSSNGLAPINKQLDENAQKARAAAAAARGLATDQEREAKRAADAQEREIRRTERVRQQALRQEQLDEKKRQADKERQLRRDTELQRRAQESTVRQATAQQRALAPQLTDITVGLATGQSPLMVLLQQGGQLKDLFGGIGPAVRAVGGAVAAVITPVTVLAGAIAVLAISYVKGATEGERFRQIVIETGSVAGRSAVDLARQAQALGSLAGSTQSSAADTLAEVVSSAKFAGEQIGVVARAAEQLRNGAGREIGATIAEFAKLADDPVKGADELNRRYGFLNGTLAAQIRLLQEQGRTQEASTVAMRAYAAAVDERTPKIRENLGLIEKAWRGIKNLTGEAVSGLATIGRDADPRREFDALIAKRQQLQTDLANTSNPFQQALLRRQIEAASKRARELADAETTAQREATRSSSQARAVAVQEQLTTEAQAFDTSQERLTREKTAIVNRAADALADAQIAGDAVAQDRITKARDQRLAAIDREAAKTPAAFSQANATLVRDDADRSIAELQRMYDRGLISAKDFFAKRRDLQLKATDAEIQAQRAELATTQEPADISRISAQIRVLERKKADIRRDAIREEAKATQVLQEQLLEVDTGLQTDALNRNLDLLQKFFDDAKVSTTEFYAARLALQEEAIDAELRLANKRLQSEELSPSDRARLLADVTKLERERSKVRGDAIRDGDRAARDLQASLDQARAQDLDNQGRMADATRIRLEAQFRDLLKRLAADGNAAGVKLINGLIDTDVSRARFEELKRQADTLISELERKRAKIATLVDTGAITPAEGRTQDKGAQADAVTRLAPVNDQLQQLAATLKDPALIEAANGLSDAIARIGQKGATGLDAAIIDLRKSLLSMQEAFAQSAVNAGVDALSNLFTDLASGTKSAGDALRDFVLGFARSMAQIAARTLATVIVLKALEAYTGIPAATLAAMSSVGANVKHGGGMAGTGPTRQVPALAFAGAPRFHGGSGVLGLKPDEIPAILQTGERVQSRAEVASMRSGDGGQGTRIINVIDPNLVQDYLTSSAGERVILNIIERNRGAVRQKLA